MLLHISSTPSISSKAGDSSSLRVECVNDVGLNGLEPGERVHSEKGRFTPLCKILLEAGKLSQRSREMGRHGSENQQESWLGC